MTGHALLFYFTGWCPPHNKQGKARDELGRGHVGERLTGLENVSSNPTDNTTGGSDHVYFHNVFEFNQRAYRAGVGTGFLMQSLQDRVHSRRCGKHLTDVRRHHAYLIYQTTIPCGLVSAPLCPSESSNHFEQTKRPNPFLVSSQVSMFQDDVRLDARNSHGRITSPHLCTSQSDPPNILRVVCVCVCVGDKTTPPPLTCLA